MFFSMDAEPRADAPLCAAISVAVGTTAAMPAACKNPRLVISCMVSPSCRDLQSWNFHRVSLRDWKFQVFFVYLRNGWPKRPRGAISESGLRFFFLLPTA